MKKTLMAAALALCAGVWAEDTARVTAPGGATADYTTLQAALDACTGGETVLLLDDVSVAGRLNVDKSVTLDLGGHVLSNQSGWFIVPADGADGLVIKNGTVHSADCCIAFDGSTSTVYATNVTFTGVCILYGRSAGLLDLQEDCVCRTSFLCSSWSYSGCALNVRGGVMAPTGNIYDREGSYGTKLLVYGGSFTHNPELWISPDCIVEEEQHTVHGIACAYRVRAATEGDVHASVTSADGTRTTGYASFLLAYAASAAGETITLLSDVALVSPVIVTKGVAINLNGHSIASSANLFEMDAGGSGFTVMNGTCEAVQTFLSPHASFANGTMTVSNCTVRAKHFAQGGNGMVAFVDGEVTCDYLTSRSSALALTFANATVAVVHSVNDGAGPSSASMTLSRGRYSFDATAYLASGFAQVLEDHDVNGVNCRYKVLPSAEAGTLDAAVAISADGTVTNAYATVAEAISACVAGGTVRLLQSCTFSRSLSVPRNMTIDLNGLTLRNQEGNFIQPAAGVTLDMRDGTMYGTVSLFNVNADAAVTVNVTNCTISGTCPVWGKGTLNLYDVSMWNMSIFGSCNGSATMNVYGGFYTFGRWKDGTPTNGTKFYVHSGMFMSHPAEGKVGTRVVADTSRIFYDPQTRDGTSYPYSVLPDDTTFDWMVEAVYDDAAYTNLTTALAVAHGSGGHVVMTADVNHAAKTAAKTGSVWLDLGGHVLSHNSDLFSVEKQGEIRITNGTLRELETGKSAFKIAEGSSLEMDATAKIDGSAGKTTCGFWIPGKNASILLNGTSVSTTRLVSWSADGAGTSFDICGDGTNTCSLIFWPGSSLPSGASLTIRGGYWAVDPALYVTNNHVILYRAAATPCKWQVKPWAAICTDGWSFDLPTEAATVTGACAAPPAGPVTVSLTGTVPTRKTLLADLTGLTFSSGGYADLSFVRNASLPASIQVSYENGRLYAWEAKGTLIVFQ